MGSEALAAGSVDYVIAGGMESMTNAPYLLKKHRGGARIGHDTAYDHMFLDGLEGYAVNPGAPFVGTDKAVGKLKDVGPIYLVVQGVEAAGRFLLGLAVELPL